MGMSTHIKGIIPAGGKHEQMVKVYQTCREAGVRVPDEVSAYFEDQYPDPKGLKIDLDYPKRHEAVSLYQADGCEGFEVDVTKLPPGLRFIRFYNSW